LIEADVAVIGGGFGATAAALAAAESGLQVVLSEATDWIGGQATAQGVSALDEHAYIERFGGTRSYYRFREAVRELYRERYGGPDRMSDGAPLNPGNGWASGICFEPWIGLQALERLLAPQVAAGRLRILLEHVPLSAAVRGSHLQSVTLAGPGGARVELRAALFLDATELGDLLPLSGAPYARGAEAAADTGEPHAPADGAHPERVQSFTTCFFVAFHPGEDHTIPRPQGYEAWRDRQPFTLALRAADGTPRRFFMFTGEQPFWTYRRVLDARLFRAAGAGRAPARDIALINWDSIDYYKENLIDRSPAQRARILNESRRLSLSFLYWLQTEAPRDAGTGARGYRGLRLLPEAGGTEDGLAKTPYIRESRRLLGYKRIVEQDIIAQPGRGARALHYSDSVGVGWYPIDLHRCAGDPAGASEERTHFPPSLPFQIPLGALLSPVVENLIAAAKNIATTHITNGAYRVHPVEWNVGEAAGMLAAHCLAQNLSPQRVLEQPAELRRFQDALLQRGVPLFWSADLGLDDPDFAVIQAFLLRYPPPAETAQYASLQASVDEQATNGVAAWLFSAHPGAREAVRLRPLLSAWEQAPHALLSSMELQAAMAALGLPCPPGSLPTLREILRRLA
jgi:hypothetical protein